jgi:hypothetical protein
MMVFLQAAPEACLRRASGIVFQLTCEGKELAPAAPAQLQKSTH